MNTFIISQRVFFLFFLLGLGACQQKNKDLDTDVSIEEIHVNDFDEHAIAYRFCICLSFCTVRDN